MFVTTGEVLELTGFSVSDATIRQAQAIVEVAAGKTESMINPVTQANDLEWIKYGVAWQCAYMETDSEKVYEQANVASVSQNNFKIDFGGKVYAMSPLTVEAMKRLSWNKSKTLKTRGFNFKRSRVPYWWEW